MMRVPIIRRSTSQPKPANHPTKVLNGVAPHPAFVHPSPPGRRCRAAADEGETPVLPTPLTRPSATLSRRRGFLTLLPPGEGAAQRRMRGKRRSSHAPHPNRQTPLFSCKKMLNGVGWVAWAMLQACEPGPPRSEPQEDRVLLQVANQQVTDREVEQEAGRNVPER